MRGQRDDGLSPRQRDERTLTMVKRRAAGETPQEIADAMGKANQFVSTATNRVRKEDIAVEPDAAAQYWQIIRRGSGE